MMRPFFKSGSQKVYTKLDIDLSANISVIGFQIEIIIGIGQNFHIGASLSPILHDYIRRAEGDKNRTENSLLLLNYVFDVKILITL